MADPYEVVEGGIKGKIRRFCELHDLYWVKTLASVLQICFILILATVSYLMWEQRGMVDAIVRNEMQEHPCPCVNWGYNPVTGDLIRSVTLPPKHIVNLSVKNTTCGAGGC